MLLLIKLHCKDNVIKKYIDNFMFYLHNIYDITSTYISYR